MPIGSDKDRAKSNADPVVEAQIDLLANVSTDPQDLVPKEADPILNQPPENAPPVEDQPQR